MSEHANGRDYGADIQSLQTSSTLLRRDLTNHEARVEGEYRELRQLMAAVSSEIGNVLEQLCEVKDELADIKAAVAPKPRKTKRRTARKGK